MSLSGCFIRPGSRFGAGGGVYLAGVGLDIGAGDASALLGFVSLSGIFTSSDSFSFSDCVEDASGALIIRDMTPRSLSEREGFVEERREERCNIAQCVLVL